jgi:cold shock CspA family protein
VIDPILNAQVREFGEREGLYDPSSSAQPPESEIFERFANYTVLARLYGTDVPLPDFSMGNAPGVDGIAILVNNQFIDNDETLNGITAASIEAEFVFTQVKRSERIDEGDIRKFCAAVSSFLKQSSKDAPIDNDDVARMRAVRDGLFERSQRFSEPPAAKLYYIYAGKHQKSESVEAIFQELQRDLVEDACYLSSLTWLVLDIDKLRDWYRTVTRGVSKDVQFRDRVELPPVAGVKLAVSGFMRAEDYLALLTDESGDLEQGIFYENVRAFLGNTQTNLEIAATLRGDGGSSQAWFPLLHNGVTVVARDVVQVGSKLSLKGVQVVNGCQSSHVLHECREQVSPELPIPTKVIVTENSEITDSIIRGTNRQNEIKDEAFVAMDGFQKGLEVFYTAFAAQTDCRPGLIYERRAHQYDDQTSNARLYSITIPTQIKSFVGMFCGEPHFAHRYYGQLLEQFWQNKGVLFSGRHRDRYAPYYVSSLFSIRLERLWARATLDRQSRSFKFLILDALRIKLFGMSLEEIMSQTPKAVTAQSLGVIDFWKDQLNAVSEVKSIIDTIERTFRRFSFNSRQNAAQSQEFTRVVQDRFGSKVRSGSPPLPTSLLPEPASQLRERVDGVVVNSGQSFGFLAAEDGTKIFFHISSLLEGSGIPPIGTRVSFDLVSTVRGPRASNIRML